MRLHQRVSLALGTLLAVQVLSAGAAVGLLVRMGPAIEAILEHNEEGLSAISDMLEVLAEAEGGPVLQADRDEFQAALKRLTALEDEATTLERLSADSPAALEGDRAARVRVLAALERLGDRNLRAMRAEDRVARQLGVAGAWAATALGVAGLGFGIMVRRQVARQLEDPILDVDAALAGSVGGEPHRRAALRPELAPELRRVAQGVNDLLDRRQVDGTQRALRLGTADRAVLLHLVDQERRPLVVVDERGEVILSNQAANELFSAESGGRHLAALHNVAAGGRPDGWTLTRLGALWVCRRREEGSRIPEATT